MLLRARAAFLTMLILLAGAPAAAGPGGFVYVAVTQAPCPLPDTCGAPQLLVFDAETTALVTRILIPATPLGIAVSPDGAYVYVSSRGSDSRLTIVDARRHAIIETIELSWFAANGPLAVNGDGSIVYIHGWVRHLPSAQTLPAVYAFDTTRRALVASSDPPSFADSLVSGGFWACCRGSALSIEPLRGAVAVSSSLGRLFVYNRSIFFGSTTISSYVEPGLTSQSQPAAAGTLAIGRAWRGFSLARDGRIYVVRANDLSASSEPTTASVVDPATLAITQTLAAGLTDASVFAPMRHPAAAPSRSAVFVPGAEALWRMGATAAQPIPMPDRSDTVGVAIPSSDKYAFVTTRASAAGGANAVRAVDLDTGRVVMTFLLDVPPIRIAPNDVLIATPAGAPSCGYRTDRGFASFAAAGGTATIGLTTTCAWHASSDADWARISTGHGTGNATFTLTVDPQVLPTPRSTTLTIGGQRVTVTQAGGLTQAPFGVVETPVSGSAGVSGSLSVTGWALDDVGVSRVRVFRDSVAGEDSSLIYVGDATLVDGARPDVQAAFPSLPFATRAGWGLMLLTNMLPNAGNGTFRLSVFAEDVEGQTAFLGATTFTASNMGSALPFGAIDTPGQGETVSGTITNWGWALTPSPLGIPTDGSTIDVVIDGVVAGHPVYGLFRPDVASLFPGYANTNTAVGYFTIDTRTLSNGVHTIAWVVRDSVGSAQGIGSRYFTVFNP